MARFSPSDAAVEGFKLAREHPRSLLVWLAAQLMLSVLMLFLMSTLGHDFLAAVGLLQGRTTVDPAEVERLVPAMGGFYAGILPLALLQSVLFNCGVFRMVLRPQDKGLLGFLSVGADELRVLGVKLAVGVVIFAAYVGVILIASTGAAVVSRAMGTGAAVAVGILLGVGGLIGLFVLMIRLSLASALTFQRRRMVVFGSWSVTRGQFWNLFGAYLLGGILGCVVLLLGGLLATALALIGGGFDQGAIFTTVANHGIGGFLTPGTAIYYFFAAIFTVLAMLVFLAPAAVACRDLTAGDSTAVA